MCGLCAHVCFVCFRIGANDAELIPAPGSAHGLDDAPCRPGGVTGGGWGSGWCIWGCVDVVCVVSATVLSLLDQR